MGTDRWNEVRGLFEAALDHTPETRAAFLDEACADDADLRREVDSLLDAVDTDEDSFLGTPALDADQVRPEGDLFAPLAGPDQYLGTQVGPYRLDAVLGTGGMGAVFLGRRVEGDFEQTVAIKLVRDALASEHLLQRFRHERRLLARLDHPHIARLLGGGVADSGLPYLVMEYVDGQPLMDYVREHRLSMNERLALFETICQAVQAAHQALIVHRDLKPSNIMVTEKSTVKLLDFGIGKLLDEAEAGTDSGDTPITRTGMRAMTPEYAAPEQIRGDTITTATDVYALGVVLYELLAGQRPYELREKNPIEIERIVCEELPRPPSDVATVGERLQGDLDTIILKALAKEPERRYGTAQQLADDVRRHLEGHPVLARPDTVGYRASRFVRRHRVGVAATAAMALLIVALGIVSTVFAVTTARQAEAVEREAAKAEQINTFLQDMLASADPAEEGYDVTVAEVLRGAVAQLDTLAVAEPEVAVALYHTLGNTYNGLGRYDTAHVLMRQGLDLALTHFGDSVRQEVTVLLDGLAYTSFRQGDLERSLELEQQGLSIRRQLYGGVHKEVGTSLGNLGAAHWRLGNYEAAEPYLLEALAVDTEALGPEALAVAIDNGYLGALYGDMGDYEQSIHYLSEQVRLLRTHHADEAVRLADALSNLGVLYDDREQHQEAIELHREALALYEASAGPDHPSVGWVLNNLASALTNIDALDEAEALHQRSLAIYRAAYGETHPNIGIQLNNMASIPRDRGDEARAEALYREAITVWEASLGPEHPYLGYALTNLGASLIRQDRLAEAEQTLENALSLRLNALGSDHVDVAATRSLLGDVFLKQGRYREAETHLLAAYEKLSEVHGAAYSNTQTTAERLAELYDAWNKPEQAAAYLPAAQ